VFDVRGNYNIAFAIMLAASALALLLSMLLRRPRQAL